MANYKNSSFYRTEEIGKESSTCPDWLEQFAEDMAIKEASTKATTAVEQARSRNVQPSIYELMSSIVSAQKPRHSSVDSVVNEYIERTGLKTHISNKQAETELLSEENLQAVASLIITAAEDNIKLINRAKKLCAELCEVEPKDVKVSVKETKKGYVAQAKSKKEQHKSEPCEDEKSAWKSLIKVINSSKKKS